MDQDPFRVPYVPGDLAVDVPAYIAALGPNFDDVILTLGARLLQADRQMATYRIPAPATEGDGSYGEGCFVYKGRGANPQKIHNRANEVGAMRQAAQWATQGRHEHAHIPRIYDHYTTFPQDGTYPQNPVYICSEHAEGTSYRVAHTVKGCLGWTVREKRRFVRQMALFRLSMIHMRSNRISGLAEDMTPGYMTHHSVAAREVRGGGGRSGGIIDPLFYQNLGPVSSEREWTEQGIRREQDFWNTELNPLTMRRMKIMYRSVFDWTPESFRTHVQYHAHAVVGRKFREPWQELDAPNADFPFCFDHGDLEHGFNIQLFRNSPRIRAVLDWETGMFVPYSWAVRDINPYKHGAGDWHKEVGEVPEDNMPFETDIYWNHHYQFWVMENAYRQRSGARRIARARMKGMRISTMNDNNFAAYGRITPRDLMFGDTLDEDALDDEQADDLDPFYYAGSVPYNLGVSQEHHEPGTWYYGPVMKLIEEFLRAEMHISPLCKYLDPYAEQWTTLNTRIIRPP